MKTLKTFYFNTGVNVWATRAYYAPTDRIDSNGVRSIPFTCENVPEGAEFVFAAPTDTVPTQKDVKPFTIVSGGLLSKFAYFRIKAEEKIDEK
jgi:hypothetical protein